MCLQKYAYLISAGSDPDVDNIKRVQNHDIVSVQIALAEVCHLLNNELSGFLKFEIINW
jgi:hypothetical protein